MLVPILLDRVELPLGFRSIQAVDLTTDKPGRRSRQIDKLLHDIDAVLQAAGRTPAEPVPTPESEETGHLQRKPRKRKQLSVKQIVQIGEVGFPSGDPRSRNFYDGSTGEREIYIPVTFDIPFAGPPAVVVSLRKIDLGDVRANIHRISVEAENISSTSFDLCFRTWAESQVYGAVACWTAVGE